MSKLMKFGYVKTYEIWVKNGEPTIFKSDSRSYNDVLDEFCSAAGYVDHCDYCQELKLDESPFHIREVKTDQIEEIRNKIKQKCSFVALQSIRPCSGICFDLRVGNIIFGPWGIAEGEMPIGELRDRGMTADQETQLIREINDAMSICEDLTS